MSDSLFTLHKFTIELKRWNEPYYLIPFGDVHRDSPNCHVEKWKEFLDWAKTKERCYFLGMGDYVDMASFSERRAIRGASFHESTLSTLNELYREQADNFVSEIEFMKGRLIGLVEGNHYGEMQAGYTTTQYMCEKLSCRYLGVSSFIRLRFIEGSKYSDKRRSLDMWVHHGKGASRLVGGSLNTVQQMVDYADADIYLMGHDHKKSVALISRLELSGVHNLRLVNRKILLGRTGSFLKGYEPDSESYVVRSVMSPTDLGVLKVEITPRRSCKGGSDLCSLDIHASI